MQLLVAPQICPIAAVPYSITFVALGSIGVCPSGGIAGSATHGAIAGGWTTNDFTHGSPSHNMPPAMGFVEVHDPAQFMGAPKGVTVGEEGS